MTLHQKIAGCSLLGMFAILIYGNVYLRNEIANDDAELELLAENHSAYEVLGTVIDNKPLMINSDVHGTIIIYDDNKFVGISKNIDFITPGSTIKVVPKGDAKYNVFCIVNIKAICSFERTVTAI